MQMSKKGISMALSVGLILKGFVPNIEVGKDFCYFIKVMFASRQCHLPVLIGMYTRSKSQICEINANIR